MKRTLTDALLAGAVLLGSVDPAAGLEPRPTEGFAPADAPPQYERARDYDVHHTLLEITFDWEARAVDGTVTHRLTPFRPGTRRVSFDQHGMAFRSIRLRDGTELPWRTIGDTLTIDLDRAYGRTDTLEISIDYRVENPPEGVYFNIPNKEYPDRPRQIWTQGEDDESHFWFPCYDDPNDRMTSEEIVTVEDHYTVIGNGELLDRRAEGDGTSTWHYRMDVPHPTYLISLIVGEYDVYTSEADGIPILSYVRPSFLPMAERSFGRTAEMMEIMNRRIGVRYPYAAYRQTEVQNFLWGGMENISATTLTHATLHDETAHEVYRSEGLVIHELAHQWWGDLVTTRNWDNCWLNEGTANYFEYVYWHDAEGPDRLHWELMTGIESILGTEKRYRRPLVTRYYTSSWGMFDQVAYSKGAALLHMLRYDLGEEVFWEVIRAFVEDHYAGLVVTEDLRRTAAEVSGRPLDRFFEQWAYRGGHPELEAEWDWDEDESLVHLSIRQTQETDELTPLFEFSMDVDMAGEDWSRRRRVTCGGREHDFYFDAPSRPLMVELDREEWLLKELDFHKSKEEWIYQLANSPTVVGRVRAAKALGDEGGADAVAALRLTLLDEEEFWGVRERAARALGEIVEDAAREALAEGTASPAARVRVESAKALGSFDDPAVPRLLEELVRRDASYHVAKAALESMAKLEPDGALGLLKLGLARDAWDDIVRRAAITAMSALGEPEAVPEILPYVKPGVYEETRKDALAALGSLGADLELDDDLRRDIRKRIEKNLEDDVLEVRSSAAAALGALGDPESVEALERALGREDHRRVHRACRRAVEKIREAEGRRAEGGELKKEIEELREAHEEMKRGLEELRREEADGEHPPLLDG